MPNLSFATPKTLRDFGYPAKDREDRGLGKGGTNKRADGGQITQPPLTRPGKTHPGGRSLRRVLSRLDARTRDFEVSTGRSGYIPNSLTRPGSRKA